METIRSAAPDSLKTYMSHVWQYRTMVWVFALRDLKIKYAQTFLGLLWSLIQPITALLIYTVFFDLLMHMNTGSVPYSLFVFSGIICWNLFSYIVNAGSMALVNNQHIISKIYFPKIILLLSKILMGLIDFGISFVILVLLMAVFKATISIEILLFPVFVIMTALIGLCIAVWLSALSISYRDLHHIVPYLVNFGIWVTPVFLPVTLIPARYSFFIYCNPLAGVIEGFRWCLFGSSNFSFHFIYSFLVTLLLLVAGLVYFNKVEDRLIDKL
jgi:lipopolysaccharide transport system permease protein